MMCNWCELEGQFWYINLRLTSKFNRKDSTTHRQLTCSWHQKTNPPIHEFKVLHRRQRAFKNLILMVQLFITLKKHFILSLVFLFFAALELENSFFWCHKRQKLVAFSINLNLLIKFLTGRKSSKIGINFFTITNLSRGL